MITSAATLKDLNVLKEERIKGFSRAFWTGRNGELYSFI